MRLLTAKIFAKKRLGQHFLVDRNYCDRIVRLAQIRRRDAVIEIGPGTGLLTRRLLERAASVTAVEIDPEMVAHLAKRFAGERGSRLTVIQADVLQLDWESVARGSPCKLVGNLPYNIATVVIQKMMEIKHRFQTLVFMLQKEVAGRVLATAGDAAYGYFSVLCAYHFDAEAGFDVPPGAFRPQPRVDSHVLRLRPRPTPSSPADWAPLNRLLKCAFGHRRKTLFNNLRSQLGSATEVRSWLRECGIREQARAQEVPLDRFLCLAQVLQSAKVER